jgi:drug/metabolite transporter (DMT)-like permease
MSWREAGRIGLAGVLLGVHFYLYFESLYHTTVASTTSFVALSPIFMAAIGFVVLRERLPLSMTVGILIATAGGAVMAWGDTRAGAAPNPAWGNLLAVAASLALSVYLIIGRVVRQGLDWYTYLLPLYTVTAATLLVLALILEVPLGGHAPEVLVVAALLALGPQLLEHGSFNLAVRYLPAAVLGLLSLTEPVGASVLALMIFDERPGALSIAGMGIALVGVAVALWPELRRKAVGR